VLPSIERTEPARTVIVPRVEPPAARSRLRFLLPWLAFGAVAVVVIVGTTLWSVALRTSAASRATPEPSGIDTAARLAAPSIVALPTTPGAATVTTEAVVTVAHSPASRPRALAPPPAPPPRSTTAAPSAVTPPDPVPTTAPDPVACDDPAALSECAPASPTKAAAKASATRKATD
jgi:hypothetical protein